MKSVSLFLFNALFSFYVCFQSVGIGTPTPHDKAVLDISSNNKGVLFPRMTTVQRNTITNPPDGLSEVLAVLVVPPQLAPVVQVG